MSYQPESVIEELFLSALLSVSPHVQFTPGVRANDLHRMAEHDGSGSMVFVAPQVPLGKYRSDFMLASCRLPYLPKLVCVECDGKEFHKATVAQMDRDERRDRFFLSRGIETMRFSGKAITRDAFKFARMALQKTSHGLCCESQVDFRSTLQNIVSEAGRVYENRYDLSRRMTGDRE